MTSIDIKTRMRLVLLNTIPNTPSTNRTNAIKFNSKYIILILNLLFFIRKSTP